MKEQTMINPSSEEMDGLRVENERLRELEKLLRQNNKDVFKACEAEIERLHEALARAGSLLAEQDGRTGAGNDRERHVP